MYVGGMEGQSRTDRECRERETERGGSTHGVGESGGDRVRERMRTRDIEMREHRGCSIVKHY